jgi:uncharacterized protein YbjT (DUF2867 family)
MTRQLVKNLPAMVVPKWAATLTQPIGVDDVVRYLTGVVGLDAALGRTFEIGGPEVLRYIDMLQRTAALKGRKLPNLSVPLLTPHLSSLWLALVTDVNIATARNLVDSMTNEVVVTDRSIQDVVPGPTLGFDDSVRLALADRERAKSGLRSGSVR